MMRHIIIAVFGIILFSCNSGPKVIESDKGAEETQKEESQGVSAVDEVLGKADPSTGIHTVVVEEVLDTDKYSYLHVSEDGEKFWIAVPRMDVEPGDTYIYNGGLLKKNFFSREYNRVFETLYLVSDIRRKVDPSNQGSALDQAMQRLQQEAAGAGGEIDITPAKGSVALADLFDNRAKYEGKKVQVTGKVVKVNPNIMGRNWIHLQDGSKEDLDLTVTTAEMIPLGHVVTVEGTIALNKDFGAGYRYDVIMEGAVIK